MKLLRRNTTEFEYFPNTGETSDLNADGLHTGVPKPIYGDPITYRGSISAPNGQTNHQFYGEEIRYTHTLLMDRLDTEIDEHGLIRWKGNVFDIRAVLPSINVLLVALHRRTDNTIPAVKDYGDSDSEH